MRLDAHPTNFISELSGVLNCLRMQIEDSAHRLENKDSLITCARVL